MLIALLYVGFANSLFWKSGLSYTSIKAEYAPKKAIREKRGDWRGFWVSAIRVCILRHVCKIR